MPISREIVYKCDSCKKQHPKDWDWLAFDQRKNMGQYYLPQYAIFCNRECSFEYLKNMVAARMVKATLDTNFSDEDVPGGV